VAVLLASPVAALAETPPNRLELADLKHLVRLDDPQIAPDGRSVVFVVSRANEGENRYDTDLYAIDVATRALRRLTHDRPGVSSPRFSSAGDRLAFLADGPGSSASQVYVMSVGGGETLRVTSFAEGVSALA
jgi:dipeptidyl aminopeptidase/acylaminoacyl peptidase